MGPLERRFQPVTVNPPSEEETVEILFGLKDKYEAHHRVTFDDDAVKSAVYLSNRYISGRALPDKAIDIIDEAGSRARLSMSVVPAGPPGYGKAHRGSDHREGIGHSGPGIREGRLVP